MSASADKPRVLMLGPLPPAVGGMTTVIELLRRGPLAGRFDVCALDTSQTTGRWRAACSPVRHVRRAIALNRALAQGEVDIVHIHTCSGFSFFRNLVDAAQARRIGAVVVLHVHGAAFDAFCRDAGPIARRMISRGLESADRVIVLSRSWKAAIEPFAPRAGFVVVPNGVPVPSEGARAAISPVPTSDICRFLYLGAIDHRKGIDVLLAAVRRLTREHVRFQVTLAGPLSEPESARLLNSVLTVPEMAAAVVHVGVADHDARRRLLHETNCLVLPSRAEGLPMTLLEAGAAGVPVIATRVGAIPDVIEHECSGLLCDAADPAGLAAAMKRAATDRAARRTWGERLNETVRALYSIEVQSTAIDEIYTGVLQERASRTAAVRPPTLLAEATHG